MTPQNAEDDFNQDKISECTPFKTDATGIYNKCSAYCLASLYIFVNSVSVRRVSFSLFLFYVFPTFPPTPTPPNIFIKSWGAVF